MARILITGASGLVGSHLVPLFGPEDEVDVVVRPGSAAPSGDNVCVHSIDLGKPFDAAVLPNRLNSVIYLAQSENFRDFPEKALDVFEVNLASLMRLLDHARRAGARSFVYASSGGVYGTSGAKMEEDSPIAATGGLGFYLSSKLTGEILCETFAPYMNVAVLRLFFVYGRGQRRSMLIPRLIDNVREGTPIALEGQDGISINPIHATDAAAACKAAMDLDQLRIVNVAGPEIFSMRALCELIGDRVGKAPRFEIRPGNPGCDLIADTGAMDALLGPARGRLADKLDELL